MKKLLLFLSSLFVLNSVAQQSKQSPISSSSAKSRTQTRANQRTNGMQPVPTTTTATCMSINYPSVSTWSPTIYSTGTAGAGGYVSGPNQYADKEKAMYFDASASAFTNLYQVDVWFAKAYSSNPAKVVSMKIYDGSSGTPSASVIATATLTMGSIMSDVAGNYNTSFYFPTGVVLPASKKFFCSVDITNLNWTVSKDSLCIVSNQNGQTTPAAAWERQSDNLWYQYSSASAWTQNVSLYIYPFLRNSPVTATFTASSPALCAGNSITFDAAGSTTGGVTYWNFGASTSPTTASTSSVSVSYPTAGTYTTLLVVLDACDALAATQATFVINPKPVVTASPTSTTICNGTSVTLNGGGASTYTWTGGVSDGVSFAPSSTLNYTVSGTNATTGCTNSAVTSVSVNPLPTVSANTTASVICPGSNVTLTGGGATSYVWTGSVTDGVAFTPSSTDTYTVIGSTASCSNTAVVTVSVGSAIVVVANASSTSICAGSNVTLTGSGASTYTWTGSVIDGSAFAPSATDTYTVVGASGSCTNSAVVTVTVNALPSVSANSTASVVCNGSSVTLSGGGASSYVWTGGVSNGVAFSPSSTNTYTVVGTTGSCSNSAVVSVTVNNLPTVLANTTASTVCTGNAVTLSGSGAVSYVWTNGVNDGVSFTPTLTNTYTVTGSDANGCSSTATVQVVVSSCTGIAEVNFTNSFVLFPNPSNGEFTIQSQKADVIVISNELGQVIETVELNQNNNFSRKITSLSSGIYFLVGKTVKQKIVVTK